MIAAKITATDLPSFYAQLVAAQEAAHGFRYCSHHEVIREKAKDCVSYAELGVNQGATLACALLAGFDWVTGVDVSLHPFRAYEGLFRAFSHGLRDKLTVLEQDSRTPLERTVDFLLIDTIHTVAHLREELQAHGANVRRFILIHDTAKAPALQHLARAWADANGWRVAESSFENVGWTLLKRIP